MSLYAVFNELSVEEQTSARQESIYMARNWVENFSSLLYQARQQGITGLRAYRHFHEIQLVAGYSLVDWSNDSAVDRDLRLRVKELFQALYRIDEFPENGKGDPLYEYRYNNVLANGLGAAHLLESMAISLLTHTCWDTIALPLAIFEMDEETESIIENEDKVQHISKSSHLDLHKEWLKQRLRVRIYNGKDLWNRRSSLFPTLQFCDSTNAQIKALREPRLQQIYKKLLELEVYCRQWKSGPFNKFQIANCTGESDATKQMFQQEHTFLCPDGESRLFEHHIRYTPGDGRIFFFPSISDVGNSIIVGHVGDKLPTVKYPNP